MTALTNALDDLRKKIYSDFPAVKFYADSFESKTGINIEYVVLGVGLILSVMIFGGIFVKFISTSVGFIYPAFATLAELNNDRKKGGEINWMMYWLVFSTIEVFESLLGKYTHIIPLFYPVKITTLLWCMFERWRGSEKIYLAVIGPYFKQNEIDAALDATVNDKKK